MDQKDFFGFAKTEMESYTDAPADAAIRHVTYRVPLASVSESVGEARERILENIKQYQTVNYVYVISGNYLLKGVISFRNLLAAASKTIIGEVLKPSLYTSGPLTDQEKVARLALKHEIKAVPIVDDKNRFLGVVSSDKVLRILHQEQQEDMLHFSGIVPQKDDAVVPISSSMVTAIIHRSPWIIVGIFGGLFTAKIISGFEETLTDHLILASFIPLVAYVANAVGTQTQTLYIRDMALGQVKILEYAVRQLLVTLCIGIISWLVLITLGSFVWKSALLGHVVGTSVMVAIMASTFFALVIPFTLKKLRVDPAIGSGPFATIIQDLLSVILFLNIADLML